MFLHINWYTMQLCFNCNCHSKLMSWHIVNFEKLGGKNFHRSIAIKTAYVVINTVIYFEDPFLSFPPQ